MRNPMNQKTCNCLRGLLLICILFMHSNTTINFPILLETGSLFVSVFFFQSGYGLYYSSKYKENYFDNFFLKRFSKLLPPFFITNFFIGLFYFLKNDISFSKMLTSIFGIPLLNVYGWYVLTTIYLYIIFYFCFKYIKNDKLSISILTILILFPYTFVCRNFDSWWISTTFNFSFGIIYAINEEKIMKNINKHYNKLLLINTLLFITSYLIDLIYLQNTILKNIIGCLFSSIVLLLSCKFSFYSKLLEYMGKYSYEIYIVQFLYINVICSNVLYLVLSKPNFAFYVFVLYICLSVSCSIITGVLLQKFCKHFQKNISLNKKRKINHYRI